MKTIRTWVYAILKYWESVVVIEKKIWPFSWLFDLPWWKIEHFENHILSLKRELKEEVWLEENDFEIEKLLTVEEDFVNHIWEGIQKEEHIMAIIYEVKILKNLNLDFVEIWWDSSWLKLISFDDNFSPKTNILQKALKKYLKK